MARQGAVLRKVLAAGASNRRSREPFCGKRWRQARPTCHSGAGRRSRIVEMRCVMLTWWFEARRLQVQKQILA